MEARMPRLCLNPTAQKDNRGVLGASFRVEQFSEIVGYSNMAIQRAHKDWKKTNMPLIERSFYLLNTLSIWAIFLYYWTQCIDGFSLLSERYVRKGNDAKNPAILSIFFVTERTQLNVAHA